MSAAGPSRRGVVATGGAMLAGMLGWSAWPQGQEARSPVPLASVAGERPPAPTGSRFPLRVEAGRRCLVDARGEPFLLHGDTAWSLIAQADRDTAIAYLDDRKSRGFNAILVNLIEHLYATRAPANAFGEPPFLRSGDFTAPNGRYFDHARWIVEAAAARGVLVLLTPAYLGARGEKEGWYREMCAAPPGALRAYGAYVGGRFGDLANVLWIHGGDYNPPRRDVVQEVVAGVRARAPGQLASAHCDGEWAAADIWGDEPWLDVNTAYTYRPVFLHARRQYARPGARPFFLIESLYENEHRTTPQALRVQAWQALVAGACGQVFGNNPVWHLDGPGLFAAPVGWREALDSPGARGMQALRAAWEALPWPALAPDLEDRLVVGGLGPEAVRATAALTPDRTLAVVHLPTARALALDEAVLASPIRAAAWVDPSTGDAFAAAFERDGEGRRVAIPSPGRNAAGDQDWALVLKAGA